MKLLFAVISCTLSLVAGLPQYAHAGQEQKTTENNAYEITLRNNTAQKVYCVFAVVNCDNTLTDPIKQYTLEPETVQNFSFIPELYLNKEAPTLFVTTNELVFLQERLAAGRILVPKSPDLMYYATKVPHKVGSLGSGAVTFTITTQATKKDPLGLFISVEKGKDFSYSSSKQERKEQKKIDGKEIEKSAKTIEKKKAEKQTL